MGLLLACCGCALVGLRQDLDALEQAAEIRGRVVVGAESKSPVFVVLYRKTDDKPVLQTYWIAYNTGDFNFLVPAGQYYVLAYEDENENATFEPSERVGWHGNPSLVVAQPGTVIEGLELTLRDPADARLELPQIYSPSATPVSFDRPTQTLGTMAAIDEKRFGVEYARKGLWEPVKFLYDPGGGLFFLEPYSETRLPVLFIHGAGGYPQEWRTIIESLDRERVQPWILHYPAGMRLGLLSEILAKYLRELQIRHGFAQIAIVAHSMGGLVARSAVNTCAADGAPFTVKLLVTLATPWQGHRAATQGVERSPVVIPSWYDMSPGSPFLSQLADTPLPLGTEFALFFGYRGQAHRNGSLSDGSVFLNSVLDKAMQETASTIRGVDADHISILKNQDVITTLSTLLSGCCGATLKKGKP